MISKDPYIIIVSYNGMPWLPKCLHETKPYPVIVVDNNSNDGTSEFIAKEFPEIILLKQSENLGFGRANNMGIAYALKQGAEYVYLLNQDAYLTHNCLQILINAIRNNEDYGILSPIHLNGTGEYLEKGFSKYVDQDFKTKNLTYLNDKATGGVIEVPFVNAAGWLITKQCLLKVGGFDPIFFHYGEDINYAQRVKYFNLKIGVVPKALMCHDREGSAIREGDRFSKRYFINMERRCKMKWADLNIPEDIIRKEISNYHIKFNIERVREILCLNFSKAKKISKEIGLLKIIKNEIIASREQNSNESNIFSNLES